MTSMAILHFHITAERDRAREILQQHGQPSRPVTVLWARNDPLPCLAWDIPHPAPDVMDVARTLGDYRRLLPADWHVTFGWRRSDPSTGDHPIVEGLR